MSDYDAYQQMLGGIGLNKTPGIGRSLLTGKTHPIPAHLVMREFNPCEVDDKFDNDNPF